MMASTDETLASKVLLAFATPTLLFVAACAPHTLRCFFFPGRSRRVAASASPSTTSLIDLHEEDAEPAEPAAGNNEKKKPL